MPEKTVPAALLLDVLQSENDYRSLVDTLARFFHGGKSFKQGPALVTGVADGLLTVLCASLAKEERLKPKGETASPAIILVPDEKTAYSLKTHLAPFLARVRVFPARDLSFHNAGVASHEWEYERIAVLRECLAGVLDAVIAVPEAALTRLPPQTAMLPAVTLSQGTSIATADVARTLSESGYERVDTVEGAGQYSLRGDILDVFPPDKESPVRVEFFGDDVEALFAFDVMTQRRTDKVDTLEIVPVCEVSVPPEKRETLAVRLDKLIERAKRKKDDRLVEKLAAERADLLNGSDRAVDKFLPFLYDGFYTLFDYAKGVCVVCDRVRTAERLNAGLSLLHETLTGLAAAGEMTLENETWCADRAALVNLLFSRPSVVTDVFTSTPDYALSGLFEFPSRGTISLSAPPDVLAEDLDGYLKAGSRVVLAVRGKAAAAALYDTLAEKSLKAVVAGDVTTVAGIAPGCVYILPKTDAAGEFTGFELPRERFVFLCEDASTQSAAARAVRSNEKAEKSAKKKVLSYLELVPGDLVVHEAHGIGRYEGIRTLTVAGVTRDYVTVRYAGNDALYVPCDQLDKMSKYAGKDGNVPLSKMGGSEWKTKKSRAKKAARDMAKELIALYAERTRRPGYAFSEDADWQREFEDGFEYEETPGQLEAIRDVKRDMEKPYPMDRLLCGDVGFGKTEVALRAAFKCVMDGKQAAVLVPTTILAFQHFRTFSARMHGFPIRIEMLSRFVSAGQAKATLERLERGETDIVVGTHKLLGKTVKFKDLGLLIVDEEQRFGVAHKERLKEMARQVDVLTLTATPIPRTFNMALIGIRDMSVLEEAPVDRYPVQTYVMEYDENTVTEALRKELRRGGQAFYLHNRTEDIGTVAARIKAALPEANVAFAHGKMSEEEISAVWYDMTEGKIDVLVCTTIIETGVDVPNANTLIIENADTMGLAQLHQLRGRVGRSNRRAYAYFTFRPDGILNETAQKRLVAIKEFTEFGSGFKIAMRDLEIRGAGDLLGSSQSGHLEAVGYDLFIKLLENAVLEEKGEKPEEETDCAVDLGVSAYIPERYIRRPAARIEMYKRIASIRSSADAADVTDELTDRYGKPPKETAMLVTVALLRARAMARGITKIALHDGRLSVYPSAVPTKEQAIALAMKFPGKVTTSVGKEPCYTVKVSSADAVGRVLEEVFKLYPPSKRVDA